VVHDSPAERGGLKAGDVITKIDGTVVTSPREISSLMRASRGKQTTSVTILRSRKELTLEVKKGERSEGRAPTPPEPPM
jgi:S1-C subfamily serine protease